MSVHQPRPWITPDEYLALDRAAAERSEYIDGEVVAMAGGSREHSLIIGNLVRELGNQLKRRPCEVHPNDLRVRVPSARLYTYPDVVVICGEPVFEEDDQRDILLNPTLLGEVLSPSTEAYDRGKKFEFYRSIPSLRKYLLVSQDEALVEQLTLQPDGRWVFTAASGLESTATLTTIGCALSLAEIYDKVDLVQPPLGQP
jgi:Uma2 family endonuclease